jgi:predicted transcriptional regulator/predicted glycosyltransferase
MVFPISSKVFAPRFYSFQDLYRNGVTDPEKIVWFNGFHTCYLKGEQPGPGNEYDKLGVKPPIVLVRPEPEFASFFPSHKPVLETTVNNIAKSGMASVVVMPRTEAQTTRYLKMGLTIIDESTSMCPVANADLTLGAAETMLMEALVLGKPAVSAIYWTLSKPVIELHRYIPHSTDPKELTEHVKRLLGSDESKSFKEKASLLVRNMDNPITLMINEIRRNNMDEEVEVTLKRRSKMEVLVDIIQASSLQPLRPTHIMRAANISYNDLKAIVDGLETKGLITSEETFGGRYYQATSDGLKLLEEYRSLRDRLF